MRGHVIAIDEGTTGVTALVLDGEGTIVGRAYSEIPQHYPKPGWVEQDALRIADGVRRVGAAAVRNARIEAKSIVAAGITNQRETTVLWDRATGNPVAPAIVWQDRRTADFCAKNKGRLEPMVRRKTGLVLDPYFSATKLRWLLHEGPDAAHLREKARAGRLGFGTIDSWLAFRLTGAHVTDETNASRTLLWNIKTGGWDEELLGVFGVPAAVLPEVRPSAGEFGKRSTLGAKIPLMALVGDQQAALFGQGCTRPGEAKNTYGTGCFLLQHTGAKPVSSKHGLLTTRAASLDGRAQFALEGSVFSAGSAIQWLRDQLGIIRSAPQVDELAAQVEDAGGVHMVPAFTGLGAPYWDPAARAALVGVTRGTDRRHIARAVLESIAFQSAELVAAMEKDSGRRMPRLRVDGGAAKSEPMLQFQADLLGRPVLRPVNLETTAMGAGYLAGIAAGLWSLDDVRRPKRGDVVVKPTMKRTEAAARMATWRRAVAAARSFRG